MKHFIEILGNSSDILSVRLKDILNCFKNDEEYNWSILWIDGVILDNGIKTIHSFQSVIDFEESINKSKNGLVISIEQLKSIDLISKQILNLLLISDKNVKKIKRFENDEDMINKCSTVIELIDGAYWEVHTDNEDFKNNILEGLEGSRIHN